jgi:2-hydroxychromene-2-carboxylate isomerase
LRPYPLAGATIHRVPDFYLDYSSPYAYLAAARIDALIPGATWRPIAFGALIRQLGKVPWSLGPGRAAGVAEVEARARARGLPPVRWPDGWPAESYSLHPLRAGLLAADAGRIREFSAEIYRLVFAEGRTLTEPAPVLEAAAAAGVDPDAVRAGLDDPAIKARLRAATDAAIARGVTGVPTVAVGDALFWGDDRLEDAAAAAAAAP